MGDAYNGQRISYTWSAFSIQNGKAPDDDTALDVGDAKSIAVQLSTAATANVSTSVDLYIITSQDGVTWDTEPFTTPFSAFGDNKVQTIILTPGANFIKFRADNNDGANNAAPIVNVYKRK